MKRTNDGQSSNAHKKQKTNNQGTVQDDDGAGDWTKVEKRKAKKVKKTELKVDVCVPHPRVSSNFRADHAAEQPP